MGRFQEELTELKGKKIGFQDVAGNSLFGEVGAVGDDCVAISISKPEEQKGNKLYNLANIVWFQSYR